MPPAPSSRITSYWLMRMPGRGAAPPKTPAPSVSDVPTEPRFDGSVESLRAAGGGVPAGAVPWLGRASTVAADGGGAGAGTAPIGACGVPNATTVLADGGAACGGAAGSGEGIPGSGADGAPGPTWTVASSGRAVPPAPLFFC